MVPTFIRAAAAHLGTGLAMRVIVLGAFVGTSLADIRAQDHKVWREGRFPGHERSAHAADVRAIAAKPDAIRHACKVFLPKAGRDAMLTGGGAIKTKLNVIGMVMHGFHGLYEVCRLGCNQNNP